MMLLRLAHFLEEASRRLDFLELPPAQRSTNFKVRHNIQHSANYLFIRPSPWYLCHLPAKTKEDEVLFWVALLPCTSFAFYEYR